MGMLSMKTYECDLNIFMYAFISQGPCRVSPQNLDSRTPLWYIPFNCYQPNCYKWMFFRCIIAMHAAGLVAQQQV